MRRKRRLFYFLSLFTVPLITAFVLVATEERTGNYDEIQKQQAVDMIDEGKEIFRHDTFGSEAFWGGTLQLHRAIAGDSLGGVGPGLTPSQALGAGLKVDVEALPEEVVTALQNGEIDLEDPAITLTLLQLNAVVGVKGFFEGDQLVSIGLNCSSCHSTVDDSFAPGIGKRLDGWANRDLNVGQIINLSPDLSPVASLLGVDEDTVRSVLQSWGPGKFDAELFFDGKARRPDGKPAATLLPSAFGLAGVNLHTYTGWGSVTHWNALVANLEMHGVGTFYDPRLKDADKFPIAAANNFDNVRSDNDQTTAKLPALHLYQLSLLAPKPPEGSFDASAAAAGEILFKSKAKCADCHVPPIFTEPGYNMHTADEIGIDDFQAKRSPDEMYRTTPLKGLWTRMKGGFYHDGRFATLEDVIDHYNNHMNLSLSGEEKSSLIEYLKSLGDQDVMVSVNDRSNGSSPINYNLYQNYPNPFNPSTTIKYDLKNSENVVIDIYSVGGELIRRLVDQQQNSGIYEIQWNGRNDKGSQVSSGIYLYQLKIGNQYQTKKMMLLK